MRRQAVALPLPDRWQGERQYPLIGLSEARAAREGARKLVKPGIHPAHARKLDIIRQGHEADSTFEKVMTPLTRPQVGTLLRALDEYSGHFQTSVALQLLWLTPCAPERDDRRPLG